MTKTRRRMGTDAGVAVPGARRRLAILGYHKIGEAPGGWDSWFYIPASTFAAQLRCLRDHNWEVIDVTSFLRGLSEPGTLPLRSALITFDDGCRSFLDEALTVLLRFGYPAVHFVPTQFIGGYNSFDAGVEPEEPIFTWDDLRELERSAVSVQSHGVSHRVFSELNPAEQSAELVRSKEVLEDGLGKPIDMYAYACGDDGKDPRRVGRALQGAGYRAACLYGGGPVRLPAHRPYHLARLAMGPDTDLAKALNERSADDIKSRAGQPSLSG